MKVFEGKRPFKCHHSRSSGKVDKDENTMIKWTFYFSTHVLLKSAPILSFEVTMAFDSGEVRAMLMNVIRTSG